MIKIQNKQSTPGEEADNFNTPESVIGIALATTSDATRDKEMIELLDLERLPYWYLTESVMGSWEHRNEFRNTISGSGLMNGRAFAET
jgi:hypothetical protein